MATDRRTLIGLAREELAKGNAANSRALCAELLAAAPDDPEGLHLLAVLDLSQGRAADALAPIERSLAADGLDPKKHQTHGLVLRAHGRRGEAARAFREALRLSPQFPEAHASLASILMEERELAEAAHHFERALQGRPGVYAWHVNLGLARSHLDDPAAAAEAFRRATELDPRAPEAHNNLGTALLSAGDLPRAEASLRRCIGLAPGHSHAWTNLGNVLRRSGRASEAEEAYRRATQCEPALPVAWVNLGNSLKDADRFEEAMQAYARAEAISPALTELHLSRAIACLATGDLERGWEEYRWRFGMPPDPAARGHLREAVRAANPIEVQGEQGLGDVLFFMRWASALRRQGAKLSFRGDPRLFPLLAGSGAFDRFLAVEPRIEGALALASGDLPWATQGLADPYPPAFPLEASGEALDAAGRLLQAAGPPPYVGVAWRAGLPSHGSTEHLHKMVPLEALGEALRSVPGTIVSLQRNAKAEETAVLAKHAGRPVADAGAVNADLGAILGLLARLDEYAGVSSTNVHLRAGLGLGARVLVPVPPEWRYGRDGATSPWFAGFTLYREGREAGWTRALDTLAADLQREHGRR